MDLDRLRESLQATRLSGRTGMEVRYLELNVRGKVVAVGSELRLRAGGQEFLLAGEEAPLARLRALAKGAADVSLTGRVQGWSGLFPDVLRALAEQQSGDPGKPATRKPPVLTVTRLQTVVPGRSAREVNR